MTDTFNILKQYEKSQATKFPTSGTIVGIDGGFIDVSARGSSTIYRHIKVVGTPTSTGQLVVLTWENSAPTAHVTGGAGASGSDVALVRGPQGLEGPEGPAGPTGAQGPQGIQGDTGATGATGSQGAQGTQGIQGIQGTTGSTGAAGAVWRSGSGAPSSGLGINGDYYLNTANSDVYFKAGGTYSVVVNIKGATGSTGSQGTQGVQGNTGSTGAAGSVWRNGSGAPNNGTGVNGDYYLNTANGDVYLRSAGTYSVATNIKGATGTTGSQGTQGIQGIQGVQGNAGTAGAPGSKWYAGAGVPSGATGVDGDQYLNATNGDTYTKGISVPGTWSTTGNIKGATGTTGSQGIQGVQGVKGDTGNQGVKGDTGTTGSQGIQGIQGIQGPIGNVSAPTSIGFVEQASAPATPAAGTLAVYAKTDHKVYKKSSDGTEAELGAGGGGAWGGITGTLSSQADLQAALDAKAAAAHNHTGVYSPVGHDHAGVYSPVGHDHAGVYSAVGHQHTSSQAIIHHANGATITSGGTMYIVPSIAGLVAVNGVLWPLAGTFLNMFVRINSTQPASGSLVFTLQYALGDTAVVTTVPANSGAGSNFNSGGASVGWPAGGLVSIKVKNNASAASAQITSWSIEFRAATL